MHTPRNVQSGYTATDFWNQWESATPRMVLCIKATTKDDFGPTTLGFTSNTRDMTLPGHPGVTFKASPAITPTIVEQALDEASNLELTGAYNDDSFTRFQVLAGMWNFAAVEVFSVSWNNTSLGELVHFAGNMGEFKDYQNYFTAEGRGKISRLSQEVNWATSRQCRAPELGDPVYCRKNLADDVTIDGDDYPITYANMEIGSKVTPLDQFTIVDPGLIPDPTPPDHFFRNGKITMISGLNAGVSREIADSDDTVQIWLKRSFPFDLEVGDTCTLIAGCDHTLEDCIKFENVVNRRAEDYVPGIEAISRKLPT